MQFPSRCPQPEDTAGWTSGKRAQSAGAPGCCQVSTAWGGARGAGHLGPPLTSTFNPARPGLSLPSIWPRCEVPAPSCPKSTPNYRLHLALYPSIYLSPCLPGTQAVGLYFQPPQE